MLVGPSPGLCLQIIFRGHRSRQRYLLARANPDALESSPALYDGMDRKRSLLLLARRDATLERIQELLLVDDACAGSLERV